MSVCPIFQGPVNLPYNLHYLFILDVFEDKLKNGQQRVVQKYRKKLKIRDSVCIS